jgi:hypothetical protein
MLALKEKKIRLESLEDARKRTLRARMFRRSIIKNLVYFETEFSFAKFAIDIWAFNAST